MSSIPQPPDIPHRPRGEAGAAARWLEVLGSVSSPTTGERYHHWHRLRHLTPPGDLTHEEWWWALKQRRRPRLQLPLSDCGGRPFELVMVDPLWRMLHELDSKASGTIALPDPVITPANRERYLASSLMEEAIASSLLEGAATTREEAKRMLRSGRAPVSRADHMVVNNHRTMGWILERRGQTLTPQMVLETHRRMTEGTLDEPDGVGRLRREDENIVVGEVGSDEVVHRPPSASELPRRMEAMCAFANDETNEPFIHPVVRSIALHFWLAYDHPFVDGNGRTARALFCWSMLRRGYWLAEFLPVSRLFQAAPAAYARAFQYSETDASDLTYFVLYHADVLRRAIADLHVYLARKADEQRSLGRMLKRSVDLNHRQVALLTAALREPDAELTIASHRASHRVAYQTARTDLLDLARRKLLEQRRVGRTLVFTPRPDLEQRLRRLR